MLCCVFEHKNKMQDLNMSDFKSLKPSSVDIFIISKFFLAGVHISVGSHADKSIFYHRAGNNREGLETN